MTAQTPAPDSPGGVLSRVLAEYNVPFPEAIGSVLSFVVTFLVIYAVGRVVFLPLLNRVLTARELDRHAKRPLQKLAWGAVLFVAVAVAFGMAGFENFLVSLATIGAAATLAVGFAMQDVIRNFAAGVFIFTDKPFRIGDWIEWDEYSGVVQDISLRVTRIRTFDNELLTVPNAELTGGVIKNPVANDTLRLTFTFGVGYEDDLEQAMDIIIEEATTHVEILDNPGPTVRLTELGDNDIGLQSLFWIADPSRADFVRIRGEYVTAVKRRFDDEGIDIPYPQRVLHGEIAVQDGSSVTSPSGKGDASD